MSIRTARVAEEIQKVLGERLVRGLRDPLPGFVTIRGVEVTSDFTHAKVFVSVFGSDAQKKAAIDGLMAQRGFLRGEVGKNVRLRHTPTLSFILDESAERAARVHALLDEVRVHGTVKTLDTPAESKPVAEARAVVAAQADVRQAQIPTPPPAPKPVLKKPAPPKAPVEAPQAAPKKPFAALASFSAYVAEPAKPAAPVVPAAVVAPVVVDEKPVKTAAKKPAAKKTAAKKTAAKKTAAKKPAAKKPAAKKPAAKKTAAKKPAAKKPAAKKPAAKKPAAKKPAAKKAAAKKPAAKKPAAKKPAAKKPAAKKTTKKAGR